MKPVIACVYKTGGDYRGHHVHRLYEQLTRYVQGPFHFVVLTDSGEFNDEAAWDVRELRHNLPGWWSKIELFRELPGAFYLDLDTTVCADITHMVQPAYGFRALRDFGRDSSMGSGVMQWGPGYRVIYNKFMEAPDLHMQRCQSPQRWGDQGFIQDAIRPYAYQPLQDVWPGQIRSWKLEVQPFGMTSNTRIICFHGKPRPWDIPNHGDHF